MSKIYSRVFLQILDSSISEDWVMRHVFEDFLKLAHWRTGIVDMTREALSRRLNIPLDILNEKIERLESPDPQSRDSELQGRRLERIDPHRNWGWRIVNHDKYEEIRGKSDGADRVRLHRERKEQAFVVPVKREKSETNKTAPVKTVKYFDEFIQFWSIYPKKVAKNDALKAFQKAMETVNVAVMINAVQAQLACDAWAKEGGKYIPNPATWLNGGQWDNEYAVSFVSTKKSIVEQDLEKLLR